MAQDYDNMGKNLWTEHAADLSRFVLGQDDVEVLEDLETEQQTVIARRTDITKLVQINGGKAILHVELQLRESTDKPMWARNAQYQGTSSANMRCLSILTSSISIQEPEGMIRRVTPTSGTATNIPIAIR